ncbi:MAG: hypothetical protein QOF69_2387 [Solirubrobacteraceae bacterium]|jgi:hypothetical protein|nr:hypothetical protein [Solirubrobacteraceae bacterium]
MRFDTLAIVVIAVAVLALLAIGYAFIRVQRAIAARVNPSDRLRVYGSQAVVVIAGSAIAVLIVIVTR